MQKEQNELALPDTRKDVPCPQCRGRGYFRNAHFERCTCETCNGNRVVSGETAQKLLGDGCGNRSV